MTKHIKILFLAAAIACTSGCVSTGGGSGVKWYNPTTWTSGAAGRDAARTDAKLDDAKESALGSAQRSAHETQNALRVAPTSRAVEVAQASNDNAVTLLDQVVGPVTATAAAATAEKVNLLTSEVPEERAKGEAIRKADQKHDDKVSIKIETLTAAKAASNAKLAAAFERENGLANELRNERWWSWFWRITIGVVALGATAGYIYLRLTLGGLPTALGRTLADLRKDAPDLAEKITGTLNVNTSRAEQDLIRLMASRHAQ